MLLRGSSNKAFWERYQSPGGEAECACFLDVQVIGEEEVFVGGAADIDARVVEPRPEDQQAEEADGESTLQVGAVRNLLGVQQLVAMVICQGDGLLRSVRMFLIEPND